jgi:hypothetical protein
MHLQTETEKMLAKALYDAGQSDREIADACATSVNKVIWWRRDQQLRENGITAEPAPAAAPPVPRPTARRRPDTAADFGMERPARAKPPAPVPLGLLSTSEAQAAHVGAVKPDGDNALEIGTHAGGTIYADLAELLTTRLLIQGNSGSGKTHLLRRLLEECAGIVQQVIVDPEGDFVSFGDAFGHTVIEASKLTSTRLAAIASRVRSLRGSVVLSLEGLEVDQQMEATSAFLGALFDAPPEDWHPALVAVDEAHLFAPAGDNGEDRETRKLSQQTMANLMCRGRKRGLAGIVATQRLSKLHKNVAAEASNFLIGRTFLDIDIARAADLLGMSRPDSEQVRNLARGDFLGLGPAISRRPVRVTVGSVITQGRAGVEKSLTPLPSLRPEDMQSLLLADEADDEADHGRDPVVVQFAARGR